MSVKNDRLLIKAIYLPEELTGEDITGTAPLSGLDCLQPATEDVTYIVMLSGRFAAVKQPLATVEAAFVKAAETKAPLLDFAADCLTGDDVRARIAAAAEAERLAYDHQQKVIARWHRLQDGKGKKRFHHADLSEADRRGIAILKERIKERAAEKGAASGTGLLATLNRTTATFGTSLKNIFSFPAKKPAVTVSVPAETVPVTPAVADQPAPAAQKPQLPKKA